MHCNLRGWTRSARGENTGRSLYLQDKSDATESGSLAFVYRSFALLAARDSADQNGAASQET